MPETHATREARIPLPEAELDATVTVPRDATGVVVFAHGSGSSRFSPRNQYVAGVLQDAGLATVLLDLLTPEEEAADRRLANLRFDIPFLARRVTGAIDWVPTQSDLGGLPIGCFGASTGAAAALAAAAGRPGAVRAVVSRGGRPDLASHALAHVRTPTLLIVGELDVVVIGMNKQAMRRMTEAEVRLSIVPGATHLFEEPGTLEAVAVQACDWFAAKLTDAVRGAMESPDPFVDATPVRGLPGDGRGRRDEVGGSGVHPASAGPAPAGSVIRTQATWGQGGRGAEGATDAGASERYLYPAEVGPAGTVEAAQGTDAAGSAKGPREPGRQVLVRYRSASSPQAIRPVNAPTVRHGGRS
jgi:putative phosphoribosyl transferase